MFDPEHPRLTREALHDWLYHRANDQQPLPSQEEIKRQLGRLMEDQAREKDFCGRR